MNSLRPAAIAVVLGAACCLATPAAAQDGRAAGAGLGRAIETAMEEEGPWLLPAEQALIARKCGYESGSRDGESLNTDDGILICRNGRRVDDPEVRAMMAVVGPRISRRVHAVLESPGVKAALSAVTEGAVQRALESVREAFPRRDPRR